MVGGGVRGVRHIGVAGVDAADEGVDDALEGLLPEVAGHKLPDALLVGLRRRGANEPQSLGQGPPGE